MTRSPRIFALSATFCLGATASCYTVDFDETAPGVFYCQTGDDCDTNQACWEFRCVDDSGPRAAVTGPEPLQNVQFGTTELTVAYNFDNFEVVESTNVVEGQGQVHVSIAGTDIELMSVNSQGANLDISSLAPGAHRVRVQAVYGDGTAYANPSATVHAVFFLLPENDERPQAAIVFPYPGYRHLVGEPLEVIVATRKFEIVENPDDCIVPAGCDPWGPDAATCVPADCAIVGQGHPHIYMLDDYPACLGDSVSCNGTYIKSLRPSMGVTATATRASGVIEGTTFDAPGTYTLSTGLQYGSHAPYPSADFIIHDQITITVGER